MSSSLQRLQDIKSSLKNAIQAAPIKLALLVNFSHQSHTVLEADLVRSSHLSGGGIAHTVEDFVEHINLLLVQRFSNGMQSLLNSSENSAA